MTFITGTTYGNRYTLGDRIAVGGMGEVWKAKDDILGRTVAIKLLSPTLAAQPGFTERFREEARNTAQLTQGNIASVYDYGQDDGASWLVMELVVGQPLSQIIKEDAPLPSGRVSTIIAQAANALQAAHDAGVIHRDVKPANILVRDRDGTVKLTDFGISRAVDATPMTKTGEVMGTAQYISPEQAMGKQLGPRSDLYSLGVVAHEMLTGVRPFDEESPVATAMAHIQVPPPPLPPDVPEPLAGVVMSCIAKDPAQRPESARAVAMALTGGPPLPGPARTEVLGAPATTRRLDATGPSPRAAGAPAGGALPAGVPTTGAQPERPGPKKRSPWIWLVPLLVLLAAAVVVATQTGLFRGEGGEAPGDTPPPTEVTSPGTVDVRGSDFEGQQISAVRAALAQLGLTADVTEEYSDQPAGTVIDVSDGQHASGSSVPVVVSRGPRPGPAPETPETPAPPAPTPAPTQEQTQPQTQPPTSAPQPPTPAPTATPPPATGTGEPDEGGGGNGTAGAGGANAGGGPRGGGDGTGSAGEDPGDGPRPRATVDRDGGQVAPPPAPQNDSGTVRGQ